MLKIGRAESEELTKIARMEEKTFTDAWSMKSLEETYRQPNALILTAKTEAEVAGYLIVYFVLDEGEIVRIAVDEAYRRQGVGGRLLLELEDICEENGIQKLLLDVREKNEGAIVFYKDNGFVEDGIRKGFYDHPREDGVLMSRRLGK